MSTPLSPVTSSTIADFAACRSASTLQPVSIISQETGSAIGV